MSQRAALLIGKLSHTQKQWQECGQVASKLYEYPDGSREDFISKCKSGEFENVFALYRSNDSNPITGDFNEEMVEALPKSLKFICHNGAGYNNIDVAACTKRGISVSSTPIAVDDATADVAIWLMLGALRNIKQSYMAVNAGKCSILVLQTMANWMQQASGVETSHSVTTQRTRRSASSAWAASALQSHIARRHLA
jgi:glyoxylate reductase